MEMPFSTQVERAVHHGLWRLREVRPHFAPLGKAQPGVQTVAAERVYRAVVDFEAGGKSHEVVANARATVHLYPLGSKVDVMFPPGRPERARLRPELPDFWLQAGILFAATLVGTGSGYTWWKLAVRRVRRRRRVVKAAD